MPLQLHNPYHVSRSMIEAFQKCSRYGYWQYLYNGTGIVPNTLSMPLTTGTCIHAGIYRLIIALQKGELTKDSSKETRAGIVREAIEIAVSEYKRLLGEFKFTGPIDVHYEFYKKEQIGITEGLIRAWAYVELPNLLKFYNVLSAEQSEVNLLCKYGDIEIKLQTRADAVIQKKDTKDIYTYSLKSCKEFGKWTMESYSRELQVYTEMWGVDKWLEKKAATRKQKLKELKEMFDRSTDPTNKQTLKARYMTIKTESINHHTMGVRFCFLVKGNRAEEKDSIGQLTGKWITYNPFIRGYKNISPSGVGYAHSWRYNNQENKSGYSNLGRGWSPFYVWDEGMTVHKWMMKLRRKEVFPEYQDIIKEHVVVPPEVSRNQERQEERIQETSNYVSNHILAIIQKCMNDKAELIQFTPEMSHCIYPYKCEYMELCDYQEKRKNPERFGYLPRTPHHEAELVQLQGIMQRQLENKAKEVSSGCSTTNT